MTGAFLLCVTFEVMGFCEGFGAYRYSRRLTPCGRGLMAPPGLTALGAKGSACDRLRLTGRLRAPPSGVMKYRCAGEVGALMGAIFYAAFGGENLHNRAFARGKTIQPPCGRRKCIPPLVAGATTLPGGKHVTGFAGRGAPL